jgi:hypothetical protein
LGGASVCVCSAAVLKSIGGFDNALRSSQDWDLWIRLREQGDIVCVNEPLVYYFVHFNYRISNNMLAKYSGSRYFYLKYQGVMDDQARRANLSFICYIKSRQSYRTFSSRLKNLFLAIKYGTSHSAPRYLASSATRLLLASASNFAKQLSVSNKRKLND